MKKLTILLFTMMTLSFFGMSQAIAAAMIASGEQDLSSNLPAQNDGAYLDPAEILSGGTTQSTAITSATVTFDPKKKDKLTIKGTTGRLSLTGAQSVILQAGSFSQEITIDKFTQSKQKYTYKGATGDAGIANLVLDMVKGQFSATVQNLFLSGFTNPLPVSLNAGTSAECSMVQFTVSGTKWTFNTSNPQYACLITEIPQTSPKGLFVNSSKQITIQAQVPSNPNLNQNSIELIPVDETLSPIGGPICTLLDNGNPANGDRTAGDNIYSCIANLQGGSPGKLRLMVQVQLGGQPTYSPSFSLDVVTPYTQQEAQQTVAAHQQAAQTWQDNLTKYGDTKTKKARDATVKAVKATEGVQDSGVSSDGNGIWIQFKSGIRGGIDLTSGGVGNGARAESRSSAWASEPVVRLGVRSHISAAQSPCNPRSDTAGGTSQVGNCNVFLWDSIGDSILKPYNPYTHAFIKIFNPDGQKANFVTNEHSSWDCTVYSLRTITDYGTVIIHAPCRMSKTSPVYGTGEIMTLQKLQDEQYMLDLLTGCLEVWFNYVGFAYYFTPNFISTLEGQFNNSIVYFQADHSDSMAASFFGKNTAAFFGFTGESDGGWKFDAAMQLFTSLVAGKNTAGAYATLPKRSEGDALFLNYSSSAEGVSYACKPVTAKAGITSSLYVTNTTFDNTGILISSYSGDEFYLWPPNYFQGPLTVITGNFTGSTYSGSWDYTNAQQIQFRGTMSATLDAGIQQAKKVISFSADETATWPFVPGSLGTLQITSKISGVGGDLPPPTRQTTSVAGQSYDTLIFQINGMATCKSVAAISHESTSILNPEFPNQWWSYEVITQAQCDNNSYLIIDFYLNTD